MAVLPVSNLNRDPGKDYFADGLTDALVTELARIPEVRVISRQSVLHLKGSSLKLDEIARDLGVWTCFSTGTWTRTFGRPGAPSS